LKRELLCLFSTVDRLNKTVKRKNQRTYAMSKPGDLDLDVLPDNPEGIYIVGGTVRDLLTGRRPTDIDLVVDGDIARTAQDIAQKTGGRIVDIGKKGFAVLRVASPMLTIDITPLLHPTIDGDLRQRDFTMNAMAYEVWTRRLVDCTGGRADIQREKIRMVSPAAFQSDPARLVRAYRMAAGTGFSIAPDTRDAIRRHRHLIASVAGERIWSELVKIFHTEASAPVIKDMADSGLLTAILPELEPAIGCSQSRPHHYDVFDHSLNAYEELEKLLMDLGKHSADPAATDLGNHAVMLKYSALLHDVGKPATRRIDDAGRIRFPGHDDKSADIARGISKRLKLSKKQREAADTIIRHHIRPLYLYLASTEGTIGRRGIIHFFTAYDPLALPIIVHAMADIMAKGKRLEDRDRGFIDFGHRLVREYRTYKRQQAAVPPLINGHDLIATFGLPPSPRFKKILKHVDHRRLSGELTSREQALGWVEEYLETHPEDRSASININSQNPNTK
jgi:poly(A) polymerase